MSKRNRRIGIGVAAAALLLAVHAMPNHRANISILAAEKNDANPHRLQAAVDIGMVAVSVLITWTERLAE
jgi:hypothetical protein